MREGNALNKESKKVKKEKIKKFERKSKKEWVLCLIVLIQSLNLTDLGSGFVL